MKIIILSATCLLLLFSQVIEAQMPKSLPAKIESRNAKTTSQNETDDDHTFNIQYKPAATTFDYEKALRDSEKKPLAQKPNREMASAKKESKKIAKKAEKKTAKKVVKKKNKKKLTKGS